MAVGYGRLVMRRFRIGSDWQGRPPHFSVIGPLGQGGMGVVEEVKQTSCDRVVALKRLRTDVRIRDGEAQLLGEAAVTASLEHPCIPAVYDIGLTEGRSPFYVMRKISGRPWSQHMAAMTPAENLNVLLRISEAVDYAHGQGVLHRDIKPENVMLGDFGEVMLMDWGFAAQAHDAPNGGHRHAPAISHLNAMSGSPRWMPPEVARGEITSIGVRSDVYLLGAILRWILTGRRPHPGSTAQECIIAASDNRFDGDLPPGPLAELALQATSSNPAARPANVGRFIELLRTAMRELEAGRLIAAARQRSDAGDHDAYLHAEGLMQQAVALSSSDPTAIQALRDLRLNRAERALATGDIALASELAVSLGHDPELEDVRQRIAEAQRRRTRRRRISITLGVALALSLVTGAYVQTGQWLNRQREWRDVAVWPGDLAAAHLIMADGETAATKNGAINLKSRQQYTLIGDYPVDDVRIELEACWHGGIDGLEIAFGARPGVRGPSLPLGYAGQVAGYAGASTFLARVADDRSASIAEGVERQFASDRWYHIVFERSADELRIVIDGERVFRRLDPLPPPVHAHGIFLRSFADNLTVRGISVTRLGHPAQTTPLVAVDALAQCGQVEPAVREALRIAEDLGHDELAFRALARACLLAATLPAGRNAELVASARQRLGRLPGAERWWSAVLEADATAAWLTGDWTGSLDACERALQADAGSQTAKALLSLPRRPLPPVDASRFLSLLMRTSGVTALDLSHLGIADLTPLAGSRIRRLSLDGNPVQNLTPLAGLPLTHLSLTDTKATTIAALRGAPLLFLTLGGTVVEDLGPLRGAPLRQLIIERSRVADLVPIGDCPLESLQAAQTPLRDLQPLRGGARQTLVEVHLSATQVSDLAPLAAARNLRKLSVDGTAVTDLAPLAGLPLESLNCSRTAVYDLSPLRGAPLTYLRCSATRVTDLSPLARMPLHSLMFHRSAVADVAPLAETPLRFLGLSESKVSDLRPLPATLEEILAWDAPLLHPPTHRVRRLVHGWPHLEEAAWQAGLTTWIRQPSDPGALQEMRVLRAIATDDLEALRRAAVVHGGRRLLHLPLAMTRDLAASWVARLGGTLYAVPFGPVDPFVIGLLPPSPLRSHRRLWTDLRVDATGRMVDAAGVVQDQPVPVRARPGMEINITGPPYPGFSVLPPGSVECEALIDLGPSMTP